MCDICRRVVCPSSCPNHEVEDLSSGAEICSECGGEIPRGALYYRFSEGTVCAECAERLDVDGILRLQRMRGVFALLDAVGAERAWQF